MKTWLSTLTLLAAVTAASTAFADHEYGNSYGGSYGGNSGYRGESAYHDGLQHNSFHRQQAHEQLHDTLSHRDYDRQVGGSRNNGYGNTGWPSSYSGGFNMGSGYSTPVYRTPNYGGYPSNRSGNYGGYSNGWQSGGSGSNWSPRW
ncbi:MAG: hypothetical protein SH850_02930 [Planctomycetaceae bacterium]|nr:hypothetical protein [Planctomycetaceae bacterium]